MIIKKPLISLLFVPIVLMMISCEDEETYDVSVTNADNETGLVHVCNWNDECSDDLRFFEFENNELTIWMVFDSAIDNDMSLASLRKNLELAEVTFHTGELATDDVCGANFTSQKLNAFSDDRLQGSIGGRINFCDTVEGDILETRDSRPFKVSFDLTFDPTTDPVVLPHVQSVKELS